MALGDGAQSPVSVGTGRFRGACLAARPRAADGGTARGDHQCLGPRLSHRVRRAHRFRHVPAALGVRPSGLRLGPRGHADRGRGHSEQRDAARGVGRDPAPVDDPGRGVRGVALEGPGPGGSRTGAGAARGEAPIGAVRARARAGELPEDGRARPAGGGNRARLQQRPDRDARSLRGAGRRARWTARRRSP